MKTSHAGRRTLLIGIGASLAFGVLVLAVVAAFALWRFADWGSDAVSQVGEAAVALIAPLREDAQRAVDDTKATVADSVAAVALVHEETRRAITDASSVVTQVKERTAQAWGEPEAIVRNLGASAAQDASQAIAVAAASVAPLVAGQLEAAQALIPGVPRHPTTWPEGLPLEQIHYRQVGNITEHSYLAALPAFDLDVLRERLVGLGYTEHVLVAGEGTWEAVYRGEGRLLLSATTRDSELRIDVLEVPRLFIGRAGP